MAAWAAYELQRWNRQTVAFGWLSGAYLLVTLAIFAAGMYAFRATQGRTRAWMFVALVLFAGVDYKAFGTSKRLNASADEVYRYSLTSLRGMADDVYRQLRADSACRVVVDNDTGPSSGDLRHIGLITPQGFDPLPGRGAVLEAAHLDRLPVAQDELDRDLREARVSHG